MRHKALFLIFLLVGFVSLSFAQQYLVNETFETFPFASWTNNSVTQDTNPHSGSNNALFNANGDYIYTAQLAKPGTLTFWGKCANGGTSPTIIVATSTNASAWTNRLTQQMTTTYTQYTVDLSAYSGIYVRFYRSAGNKNAYIDDIMIRLKEPATQTIMGSFTNVTTNQITINWTNGDGDKRVVFLKQGSGATSEPIDGLNYTASSDWSVKGTQLGSTEYYCVYNNTGTSVTVTNLSPNTAYYVAAYEYNTAGTLYEYHGVASTGNTTTLIGTYTVDLTSTPEGALISVDSTPTIYTTPYTFNMTPGSSATYSVAMDGYTFEPETFSVNNIAANTSQEFTGTLIPVPVVPADTPTELNGGPLSGGVTIGSRVDLYTGPFVDETNVVFTFLSHSEFLNSPIILSYSGAGASDVTITVGPGSWYGLVYYGGEWHFADIPDHWPLVVAPGNTATMTFLNIDFNAKNDVVFLLNDGGNPLPIELSSFTAVLTSQYFISLTWITESETQALGFNVRRSDTNNIADSRQINMAIIPATNTSQQQSYTISDTNDLVANQTYYYWLESIDIGGSSVSHGPVTATVLEQPTPSLPEISLMKSAYPNPLRLGASTTIDVDIKAGEKGTVTVYNILGQSVKTFKVNQGPNKLTWNAKGCASGIYFYKLSSPSLNTTKKLVILN